MTIQQAFEFALQHHQSGRLAEAETIYRQILAADTRHADALHFLGVLSLQTGRMDVAVKLIRQAIALRPDYSAAYDNLGTVLRNKGELAEAIAAHRLAIALAPGNAETHYNLGNALHDMRHVDEAIAAYRQAIVFKPTHAKACYNLGNALRDQGRMGEAIAAYRQALALDFNFPEAHANLGAALHRIGELDEAIAACQQAITLNPNYAEAHTNLGAILRDKGQLDGAIAAHRRAIALRFNFPEAHSNLGVALHDAGRMDEAIAAYQQAIALRPNYSEAHSNLGAVLHNMGQMDEAIAAYRRAISMNPDCVEAHSNLRNVMKEFGQLDPSIAAYRQDIALTADFPVAHSNLLLSLNYHPDFDALSIAEEHRRWGRECAEPLRPFILPHTNDRNPDRRLRIGYVSPDFREHSVAFFLESLLDCHDCSHVEVFGYADVRKPDAVTARMEQHVGSLRRITGMTDSQVCDRIREDGIDILVDLAGHTANHRLPVFAREPAPVQVTWLGYPNTTGLESIDYRLTDAIADPPGTTEHLHTEQLVRLPETFACFRPAGDSPAVGPLPALARGHITFGSFHTLAKLNDELLEQWAKILKEAAGSRLLLVSGGLNDRSCQRRFIEFFEKQGIDPGRLEFRGRQNLEQYLALHHEVDILLDSHPFSGHTVSCHALWMGVPVVTLAGSVHCSRMVASVLTNVGLPELIAQTPGQYVEVACELGRDLPRLAGLRSTLRERMQASALLDGPRFARAIESAYREMWRKWCANETDKTRKALADE